MDVIPKATPNTKGWSGDPNSPGLGEITNLCIDGIASAKKAAESVLPSYTTEDKGKTLGLGEQGPGWVGLQNPTQELLTVSGTWVAPTNGIYQIEIQGAGAGAGACLSGGGLVAGGNGAAGDYIRYYNHYTKGDTVSYTIGAPGIGGSSSTTLAGSGSSGGDTTFGGVKAAGGKGGVGFDARTYTAPEVTILGATYVKSAISTFSRQTFNFLLGGNPESGGINPRYTGIISRGSTPGGVAGLSADPTDYGAGGGAGIVFGSLSNTPGKNGIQGCVRVTLLVAFGE